MGRNGLARQRAFRNQRSEREQDPIRRDQEARTGDRHLIFPAYPHRIRCSTDPRAALISADAAALVAADPLLAAAGAVAGDFPVEVRDAGLATLLHLILEQQVSIAAAAAMFRRLRETLGEITPEGILGLDDATMRRCGFSRQKAGYARDLARALQSGSFSFERVAGLDDTAALAALMELRGIGRWTAENYLLFALVRRDVFPAGDLALRIGWERLAGRPRPTEAELRERAAVWAPRRSAAAYLIWHYYLGTRGNSGGTRSA